MIDPQTPFRLVAMVAALAGATSAQRQFRQVLAEDVLSQAPTDTLVLPAAGDVDGNGVVDLVFAGPRLRTNDRTSYYAGGDLGTASAAAPTLGDVDGDGDLDILQLHGRVLRQFVNDGGGNFTDVTEARMPPVTGFSNEAVALVDVDRDGDLDAFVSNAELLINDGRGYFTDETGARVDRRGFALGPSLAVADFDHNGGVDFVTTSGMFRNDGAGRFKLDDAGALRIGYTELVFAVDYDLDGHIDLVRGSGIVLRNDGTGHFQIVTGVIPSLGQGQHAPRAAADFDGDGAVDLILSPTEATLDPWYLVRNDGVGGFAAGSALALPLDPNLAYDVLARDLDGDGDADLVVTAPVPGSLAPRPAEVLYNDGSGRMQRTSGAGIPRSLGFTPVAIDIDGDGDQDIVQPHAFAVNDGQGNFTTLRTGYNDVALFFAVADFDRDGDLDFAVAGNATDKILFNDGTGRLTAGASFDNSVDWPTAIVAFDIDADGDVDLAIANSGSFGRTPSLRIYRNDGRGGMTLAPESLPGFVAAAGGALAAGDVDADGDRDLVFATVAGINGPAVCMLFANDGAGVFQRAAFPSDTAPIAGVQLVDLDGDGDLDVLTDAYGYQPKLFANDGRGAFVAHALPTSLVGHRVFVDDIDDDGDLDLWAVGAWLRLMRNDGASFVEVTDRVDPFRLPQVRPSVFLLIDLDDDGDRDALLDSQDPHTQLHLTQAYWNHGRQLRTPHVARAAAHLRYELSALTGAARQPVAGVLWLSPAAAYFPLGALGTLRLDPRGMVSLPPQAFPPQGAVIDIAIPTPPGPSLAGLSVHGQMLWIDGFARLRLGNAVTDTFLR